MHSETNRNKRWGSGPAIIIAALFCLLLVNQARAQCDSNFKFSGAIQALPSASGFIGDWMVSGRVVHVNASTRIERDNNAQPMVGAFVEVEGCLQTDGSVIATQIELKPAPGTCDGNFKFSGVIQTLPSASGFIGDWMVSGRTVRVNATTRIERDNNAQPMVGGFVEVEGCLQTDSSVIATQIELKPAPGAGMNFDFTGNVEELPNTTGRLGDWKIAGIVVHVTATTLIKQENGTIAVGVRVQVEGSRRADGSVDAFKIEVESETGSNGQGEFIGTIESLPSAAGRIGQWTVSGRKVNVTASTRIKPDNAAVAIGFVVQVKGDFRQDGSIDATEIEVKSNGGAGGSFVEFQGAVETLPETAGQIGAWAVSGRKVNVAANMKINQGQAPVTVGSTVEVRGALLADGSINAVKIEVKNRGGSSEFYGKVERLPAATSLIGDWRVSGRMVRVAAPTRIEREYGIVTIGAFVGVNGALQSDGSIDATKIEVKQGSAGGAYMNFNPASTVSAASYLEENAPESIVSAFGANLSSMTASATTLPLPLSLGNVSVIVDGRLARLFFVSPSQINYQIPPGTPSGTANMVVTNNGQMVSQGAIAVSGVAPSLFTANASGDGPPAGLLLRVRADGQQVYELLARFDAGLKQFAPAPIVRQAGEQLFLILFGTGLKQAPNTDGNAGNGVAESVQVSVGGVNAQVVFAGAAQGFVGLEQINVRIPDSALSNPNTAVVVKARDVLNNQKQANIVTISLQ